MAAALVLVFAAAFLGALALLLALVNASQSPAAKVKSRLRQMVEADPLLAGEQAPQALATVERSLSRLSVLGGVSEMIERAGVRVPPLFFVLWIAAASVSSFAALFLLRRSVLVALTAALGIVLGAVIYLRQRRKNRETRFTEQLPDLLVMIARSLRAGHALSSAVELISEEMPEPAGPLFRVAYEQQRLGMRMADSLATLPGKIDSIDLNFFVTIIRINSDTGGNLAEILDKLAETIRSRLQVRRQVQVCTAEGRMSGYVLVILPVVVFALFYLLRPGYVEVFFTERTCQLFLMAAAALQVIGFLFIRKIINIRI